MKQTEKSFVNLQTSTRKASENDNEKRDDNKMLVKECINPFVISSKISYVFDCVTFIVDLLENVIKPSTHCIRPARPFDVYTQ